MTGVIKLFARRASRSRSNAEQTASPAVTRCPAPRADSKPSPSERHRVDADVQQDFCAVRGAQRHRMLLRGYRDDDAIARRMQRLPGRIDRDSITEHARREHGIRHFVERRAPSEAVQETMRPATVPPTAAPTRVPRSGIERRGEE